MINMPLIYCFAFMICYNLFCFHALLYLFCFRDLLRSLIGIWVFSFIYLVIAFCVTECFIIWLSP